MQARVFDKVGKVAFSPCVFLTRPIVSPASLRIYQSVRVFDKVHCVFCKARVLISRWQCVFDKLHCQPPGLCSAQGAWFSGKPCSINICSKAGGTTPRHSGFIFVFRTVGDRCKMTILRAAPLMV